MLNWVVLYSMYSAAISHPLPLGCLSRNPQEISSFIVHGNAAKPPFRLDCPFPVTRGHDHLARAGCAISQIGEVPDDRCIISGSAIKMLGINSKPKMSDTTRGIEIAG